MWYSLSSCGSMFFDPIYRDLWCALFKSLIWISNFQVLNNWLFKINCPLLLLNWSNMFNFKTNISMHFVVFEHCSLVQAKRNDISIIFPVKVRSFLDKLKDAQKYTFYQKMKIETPRYQLFFRPNTNTYMSSN